MKTKTPIEQLRSYIFKNINHPHFLTMNMMLDEIEAEYMRHVKPDTVENLLEEFADMPDRIDRIAAVSRYAERIRAAVDTSEERDRLRAEVKKLGEQLDRLRNDGGLA